MYISTNVLLLGLLEVMVKNTILCMTAFEQEKTAG